MSTLQVTSPSLPFWKRCVVEPKLVTMQVISDVYGGVITHLLSEDHSQVIHMQRHIWVSFFSREVIWTGGLILGGSLTASLLELKCHISTTSYGL